jgi:hypothetical protein
MIAPRRQRTQEPPGTDRRRRARVSRPCRRASLRPLVDGRGQRPSSAGAPGWSGPVSALPGTSRSTLRRRVSTLRSLPATASGEWSGPPSTDGCRAPASFHQGAATTASVELRPNRGEHRHALRSRTPRSQRHLLRRSDQRLHRTSSQAALPSQVVRSQPPPRALPGRLTAQQRHLDLTRPTSARVDAARSAQVCNRLLFLPRSQSWGWAAVAVAREGAERPGAAG